MCYPNRVTTMAWLRRSFFVLALVGGTSIVVGCGSSEARTEFGKPTSDDADAGNGGEVLPPEDAGTDATPNVDTDGRADSKCTPTSPTSKDQGTVCIRVGRATDGPPVNDETKKTLNIDGDGVLLVALMPDPWVKGSKPAAVRIYPSPSTPHLYVASDLPRTVALDVPAGKYLAFAMFYDQPGYARDALAGDWTPKIYGNDWVVPKLTVTGGAGLDAQIDLYPIRTADITVTLATGVHPIGSGSGPLIASLTAPDGVVIGDGRLGCADVVAGNPVVRLITTAPPSAVSGVEYSLEVGLYDFAAGPDDPILDPVPGKVPPGSLLNWKFPSSLAGHLLIDKGWVTAPTTVALDHVVPFATSPAPTDPSPSCTAYGAAPK